MKIMTKLPVLVPDDRIYMRLGKYKHFAETTPAQQRRFEQEIARAKSLCRPSGTWDVIKIADNDGATVRLEGGDCFASPKLAEFLRGSSEILLFAATAGQEICDAVKDASAVEAAIYDAVGSETADAAIAWVQDYARQTLRPRGLAVSEQRFSPGYGGLDLSCQEIFFRRLKLAELGMSLTPAFFMLPEKSVTALAGIRPLSGE